jgi:hypothetical protein
MPVERVAAFIRGESDESFEELALAVFRFQYERVDAFRGLCDERGATPARISDWRQVPAVSEADFGGLNAADSPAQAPPYPDLLRAVIDHSLPGGCLESMGRPPVLSLVPTGEDRSDPRSGFMADHLLRTHAAPDSSVAVARRGVEAAKARSFLGARQRDRRPTLVLATAVSLAQLLEALDRRGLRFRLPPGSRVIEIDGPGAHSREILARLADSLALPPAGLIHEFGAHGLTSRFYAGYSRRGEPRPFRPPSWARTRVLDPETLAETPAGVEGRLAVFDLASVGSAAHLLTADFAVAGEEGFRLTGHAAASTA